jgi:hypothetical protein
MFEHEKDRKKTCGKIDHVFEFMTDMRSFETATECGEGMALKIRLERDSFPVSLLFDFSPRKDYSKERKRTT